MASASRLKSYLSDDEELEMRWTGKNKSNTSCIYGATDSRIVYYDSEQNFKDIPFSDVKSVEEETKQDTALYGKLSQAGFLGFLLSILLFFSGSELSLMAFIASILSISLAILLKKTGGRENVISSYRVVKIKYGDKGRSQLQIMTDDNSIGSKLSRLVRQSES